MDPKVFVIVLNWNRVNETRECLKSLQAVEYPDIEIVLVDNCSADGSVQILRREFSELTIIQNEQNLGYAEGNNVGIRYALEHGADYVLMLNNDTVVDRSLLRDLVAAAESDRGIGIVGPKIYDFHEPTMIWFAGAMIDWKTGESPHIGLGERDRGQYEGRVEVDRVTGCAMMVRRDVFERVGLFDPRFFLYYEDVDLCLRARSAGYKIVCARNAKVWHKESSSTKANEGSNLHLYYHTRNRLLFLYKHARVSESEHRDNRRFFTQYLSRLALRPFDQSYRRQYAPRFWALTDFYLGRYGIKAKYHRGVGASGA